MMSEDMVVARINGYELEADEFEVLFKDTIDGNNFKTQVDSPTSYRFAYTEEVDGKETLFAGYFNFSDGDTFLEATFHELDNLLNHAKNKKIRAFICAVNQSIKDEFIDRNEMVGTYLDEMDIKEKELVFA